MTAHSDLHERARAAAEFICPPNDSIFSSDKRGDELRAGIIQGYLAGAKAARVEAVKAVCDYCRNGDVPRRRSIPNEKKKVWMHGRQFCLASGIWKLAAEEPA